MLRREFIAGLGSAAGWPVVAYVQQRSALPVIGILRNSDIPFPFRKGLSDMGYVEGRNVIIEDRATDQVDRLPALAAELVARRVTVIFAQTLTAAAAAKAATKKSTPPLRLRLHAASARCWSIPPSALS
jgi:putative ABC transport system substrate-binding protein